MDELLVRVRKACAATAWSRGVELARAGAVQIQTETARDVELRVATQGGLVAPLVTLFLDEHDWSCECASADDACAHVAAAVIAMQQAAQGGTPVQRVAAPSSGGRIGYRFVSLEDALVLRRVIVLETGDHPLDGTLAAVARGKVKGPKFVATEADLRFEKALGTFSAGIIARTSMTRVFEALAGAELVTLDGDPVGIGAPACGLLISVRRHPDGRHVAEIARDNDVVKVFRNGAIARAGKLHPIGPHGLSEPEYDELMRGKWFAPGEVATLVGDLVPRWRRVLPVRFDGADTPKAQVVKPRMHVQSAQDESGALSILATVVYGDPPIVRVDGDRLTVLGDHREIPLRNVRLEQQIIQRMRREFGLEPGVRRSFTTAEAIAWQRGHRSWDEVAVAGTAHETYVDRGALIARLDNQGGSPELSFTLEGDGASAGTTTGRAEARSILQAWERGDTFVPLIDGGFGRIPVDWLARHGDRVAALLRAREQAADDELPAWAVGDVAALCAALEQPPPPQWNRWRALFEGFTGLPEPQLPSDLDAELRSYQRDGVAWLSFLRDAGMGGLLADDMGLGKTLQTLCSIRGRTLVVAPTSVIGNWQAEIARFRPQARASVFHGGTRERDATADITLTTYALLRLDRERLVAIDWDTVVLDEAQAIKNPDSQVARAAYELRARFKVALTGTPVENRLEDLWSQMHFASPGLLGGRSDFAERFARPIASGSTDAALALRERIRPFVLRRLKRDVARELPPRTDVVLHCELSDDERAVYDAVRLATKRIVTDRLGAGDSTLAVLEALLRLRQAACHRALVPGQSETPGPSAKLSLLVDRLDLTVAAGHKALVFSQWTSLLDLVEPALRDADLAFTRLDGSTRDRPAVVAQFQDPAGPPIMLISLRAGGTGLNLTAADHVYLLDPWWNPAVEDQAADRAHRIGQDKPVIVHRLVARGTVEEGIVALQERKRALADAAVAGGSAPISRDELLALLD